MKADIAQDRQMLEKCVAGDKKILEEFVRRFSSLICKTVRKTLVAKNVQFDGRDIEDLHHTVFLKLFDNNFKKLKQYGGLNGCSLATWLHVVTLRIVLNELRKKMSGINGSTQKQGYDEQAAFPECDAPGILELMIKAENKDRVEKGLRMLSPKDRTFIKLHIENGLPIKDVAETMALTMGSAYTMKHRVISRLKSFLAAEERGNG